MSNKARPSLFSNHSHQRPMSDLVGTAKYTLLLVFGFLREITETIIINKQLSKLTDSKNSKDPNITAWKMGEEAFLIYIQLQKNIKYRNDTNEMDLIHRLIISYFDHAFYWNLSSDELCEFKDVDIFDEDNQIKIVSDCFKIKDFIFECILCPNGSTERSQGCVLPYIRITHFPKNIYFVILCYEIYCIETGSNYKTIHTITYKKHDRELLTWPHCTLPLKQCQNVKSLHFMIIIDILKSIDVSQSIKFKQYHHRDGRSLSPHLPSNTYKWVLSKDNLIKCIKQSPFRLYFCSPNFCHDTWFFYAYPRFDQKHPKYIGILLGLQLLSKSPFVESVYTDITIIQLNGKKKKVFNYKRKIYDHARLDFYACDINSPLSFVINIKIMQVCCNERHPQYTKNKNVKQLTNSYMFR